MPPKPAPKPLSGPPPTTAPPPGSNSRAGAGPVATKAPEMAIPTPRFEPPRIVLSAVEGWGKTSCGAYAPGAAIITARGETGYQTLLGARRVPAIPAVHVESWAKLLAFVDQQLEAKLLVIDSIGPIERLCQEHVCQRDFGGDWGEHGFASYGKGYELSAGEWLKLLVRLDGLREACGVTILLLSHIQIKAFKNPLGPDYDRYTVDCHHKIWAATHRWVDAVLFGNFETILDEKKGQRPKGIGGTDRLLFTERRDAWDAKNRYGMPEFLAIPPDPAATWGIIRDAIKPKENRNG